jgi:hypothetical protein
MAKAKKAAKKGKAEDVGVVVVASKVRAVVRGKGVNMSSDVIEALDAKVKCLLTSAVARTVGNKRKTLRAVDL